MRHFLTIGLVAALNVAMAQSTLARKYREKRSKIRTHKRARSKLAYPNLTLIIIRAT